MSDDWFQGYLSRELASRGIDASVFTSYISSILQEGSDVQTIVDLMEGLQIESSDNFASHIFEVYNRGFLLPNEAAPEDNTADAAQECAGAVLEAHDAEEVFNLQNDGENDPATYYDEMPEVEPAVDLLSLIEETELQLSSYDLSFSPSAVYSSLQKSHGDIPGAISVLQNTAYALQNSKPCRHLLSGRCSRSDCHFDHNLSSYPCRYWLYNQCAQQQSFVNPLDPNDVIINYGTCPFLHDCIDTARPSSLPPLTSSFVNSAESFPQLAPLRGGSTESRRPASTTPLLSFTFARRVASSAAPELTSKELSSRAPGDWRAADFVSASSASRQSTSSASNRVLPSEWVESGRSVAADYAALRAEARQFAVARNKLLEEATRAFRAGGRSEARNLSVRGQEMGARMKECHVRAAQAIFKQRNTPQSVAAGRLDLHGLHVAEALECLDALLPALQGMRLAQARVVTGSGNHTLGPQKGVARLFPAVEAHCAGLQLRTSVIKDDNGFSGGLVVYL